MTTLRPYLHRSGAFLVLFLACAVLRAEVVDSVALCYDAGFQYLKNRQYAEACKAFDY